MNESRTDQARRKPSEERVWLKWFPAESLHREIAQNTIYEYIRAKCMARPDGKALYYYGTSVTYRQLLEKIDRCAEAFYGMGIREGDYVSFLTPTTPEAIYSMYGLNKIGAIGNFIDPRMDIQRILDAAKSVHSKLLVTIDVAFPKVARLLDQLEEKYIIVSSANTSLPAPLRLLRGMKGDGVAYGGRILHWKELMERAKGEQIQQVSFREGSVATITYTGGTTGTPKGVMLTNDGLNSMAESFVLAGVDHKPGDRFLEIMPIFASYGVGCGIHMPLAMHFEDVVIPAFTPDKLGQLVRKYRPAHMMAVPAFYEKLLHSKALWDFDLSFLLTTGCGGDTMNPGLEARFNRFLKEKGAKYSLSQGYGMSEMSGAATCCFSNIYKDDSSGIPLLCNTIGIFDPETGEELDYGQDGEVCMTGRGMMKGYHGLPAETANVIRRHADGRLWIHSGDIGHLDKDGFVYIRGRIKQIIIKFDGHKVFPVQVEGIISRHKAVGACAVVGIPDPAHGQGQVPLGIVELKATLAADADRELIRREILTLCQEQCEERGRPADIVFIDKMLHTGLNKHDYRALSERYQNHTIRVN